MDYLSSLTNDEIMIQENLKLTSIRKIIYSYFNDYLSLTKLEGKLNILDIHKNKYYDSMFLIIIDIMIKFDNYEDNDLAKDLIDYIFKIDNKSFSDFINNINY